MRIYVAFYKKKILIHLNDVEKHQTVFSLCLEGLKRMGEEGFLSKNIANLIVFKNLDIRLKTEDKVIDVLDNEDNVIIVLNENDNQIKGLSYSLQLQNSDKIIWANKVADTKETKTLDGNTLSTEDLVHFGSGKFTIELKEETWAILKESRKIVDDIVDKKSCVYGINTGFGKFATTVIPEDQLEVLQVNLIRSHAAGIGDFLPNHSVRMLMALRINVLAKGYSGISPDTLESVIQAFNSSCLPVVPEQGTVGASGDLAPLSHIVLGLLGEGKMWSPSTGIDDAATVLEKNGLKPLSLKAKEGLALINGTQMITALGAECVERAKYLCLQADVISALTVEVLKGNVSQFDADIHAARPHEGQIEVARRISALLHSDMFPSECFVANESERKVQDPYTLRCIPQVHGITMDTVRFASKIITTEMNSATDNPMVLRDRDMLISGGNFHGEYPAKALDFLAIGVHELANISERRIERLVNNAYSEGLPSFLVHEGGLNSGFMIAHCTAAALTSENKVLCHPSSSDTLTTSGGTEDHVSMGGWSARKCLKVIRNVENILAIEMLAACQAFDIMYQHTKHKSTEPLEAVHKMVRKHVSMWKTDRYMSPDIELAANLLNKKKVWNVAKPFIEKSLGIEKKADDESHDNESRISRLFEL